MTLLLDTDHPDSAADRTRGSTADFMLARIRLYLGANFGRRFNRKLGAGGGRPGQSFPPHTGGLRPGTVAALQQLATLARPVREQRLHDTRARLARAVAPAFDQFRYGWANNLPESEAHDLYPGQLQNCRRRTRDTPSSSRCPIAATR
jgi:hypothetical protein